MAENAQLNDTEISRLQSMSAQATASTAAYLTNSTSRASRIKALTDARALVRELETSDDAWFSLLNGATTATTVRWLQHLGIPSFVPLSGSISVASLATKISATPTFLARFMRITCAAGVFEEVEPDVYAHTKASRILLDPGYGTYYELIMDVMLKDCVARYPEYYSTHPLEEPGDPKTNPFAWAYGMEGSMWHEVFASRPEMYAKFVIGMRGKFGGWSAMRIYPFGEQLGKLSEEAVKEDGVLIVDIGGSVGGTMVEIKEAYPELKGRMVVQDIPSVIKRIGPGDLPKGIDTQAHDFWTPQPIKGAKVYWLRRIMHDWPDEQCVTILRHTADAMTDESKVLAMDMLIPESVQSEDTFCYMMDLCMMMFGGKERTEVEWRRLFDASGLELVRSWKAEAGQHAVIEGRKKRVVE